RGQKSKAKMPWQFSRFHSALCTGHSHFIIRSCKCYHLVLLLYHASNIAGCQYRIAPDTRIRDVLLPNEGRIPEVRRIPGAIDHEKCRRSMPYARRLSCLGIVSTMTGLASSSERAYGRGLV